MCWFFQESEEHFYGVFHDYGWSLLVLGGRGRANLINTLQIVVIWIVLLFESCMILSAISSLGDEGSKVMTRQLPRTYEDIK